MPLHKASTPLLVILSVLMASAASYAALDLAGRVTAARGRERLAWLAGGSLAMGVGIWSMHFVGMLAFRLPVPIGYQPKLAASLVAARPELRVLYMSGFTESAVMYHGMLDPGTDFIQKPFSPQALGLKVQEALRKVATGQ
jgi:NO-binding membrane sensor protein with MHYT domain